MSTHVKFSKNARTAMVKGIDELANVVKVTLGPKGRNVVIENRYGSPLITNDGVSIAKEIEPKDPYEKMGAKLVYEVANNTNELAGDGTTTATILAQAMIHKGLNHLDRGANPVLMRRGIDMASKEISKYLLNKSVKIESSKEIANVASISSGSEEIGSLIAKAMEKVGRDGVISVDNSNTFETELEVVEGMQYDKGYISPHMVTNRDSMTIEQENPDILVTDHKISSIQDILHLLENTVQTKKPMLIIAEDISQEVVATLVINKLRGTFDVSATKAPGFGDSMKEQLNDIAILTGATFISKDLNMSLKDCKVEDLGSAEKAMITKDTTTIINGNSDLKVLEDHIKTLKNQIEREENDFTRKNLEKRYGRLTRGVAVIKVGAMTETEAKEKKLRIEDALNATRAAVSEGVVAGGGYALLDAYANLSDTITSENPDIQRGIRCVFDAVHMPLWQIAENAGYDGNVIVKQQLNQEEGMGFNAETGDWVNMLEAGILDPTKVTRSALLNAASIASIFLTTEAAVIQEKEKENLEI